MLRAGNAPIRGRQDDLINEGKRQVIHERAGLKVSTPREAQGKEVFDIFLFGRPPHKAEVISK